MSRYRPSDYLPADVLKRQDFIAACSDHDMGEIFGIAAKWGGPGFSVSHIARRCEMTVTQVQAYIKRRASTYSSVFRMACIAYIRPVSFLDHEHDVGILASVELNQRLALLRSLRGSSRV